MMILVIEEKGKMYKVGSTHFYIGDEISLVKEKTAMVLITIAVSSKTQY